MCFSAEADLIGGVVISAVGIDVLRHVSGRPHLRGLAALPLLFGAHQLTETFVWWGLQRHVPAAVGNVAMWSYLIFAFVVLPTYVPVAVFLAEAPGVRRRLIGGFIGVGAIVSLVLLGAMLRGDVTAEIRPWHLTYGIGLDAGPLVVAAYVMATCGSFLFSSIKNLQLFGIVNLIAVAALAAFVISGFASLWCAWAAITSALFALHLRSTDADPKPEPALATT